MIPGRLLKQLIEGSILGRLLFLIYINDNNSSLSITSFCFADDTTVFDSSAYITDLYQAMNTELHCLHKWTMKPS